MSSRVTDTRAGLSGYSDMAAGGFGVRGIIGFYRRRWVSIALCVALGLGASLYAASTLEPRHTSTAQLMIEAGNSVFQDEAGQTVESSIVESQTHVLRSIDLLTHVVERTNLLDDPDFVRGPTPSFADRAQDVVEEALVALGLAAAPKDSVPEPAVGDEPANSAEADAVVRVAQRLRSMISVSREGRSNVISLTVTASTPRKAAFLVDSVVDTYIETTEQARVSDLDRASTWLRERLNALQAQLKEAEDAVEAFRAEHNLLATRSGTLTEQQLSEINMQLIRARAELTERRAAYQQAQDLLGNGGDIYSIPEVIASDVVDHLRAKHAELLRREAELRAIYGANHAQVIQAANERLDAERQLAREIDRIVSYLSIELEMAQTREAALSEALKNAGGQTGVENQVAIELRELERAAAATRTLYEGFLSRAQALEEGASLRSTGIHRVSSGTIPENPSFPPKKVIVLFGLLLGGALGTIGALARESLQAGVMTIRQAEAALERPVIAAVPSIPAKALALTTEWRMRGRGSNARAKDAYMETVRTMRHTLLTKLGARPAHVVQVTSAVPGEGKTTLAISLAASAAGAGYRVLFIDADLRRAGATRRLGFAREPGLTDLLRDGVTSEQVPRFDDATGIHVVPAGSTTANPPDLLNSPQMQAFLEAARDRFDLIVLDSSPVGDMADAGILSRHADVVAFVIRWSSTPAEVASLAVDRIERDKASVVLNMIDERRAKTYGNTYGIYR